NAMNEPTDNEPTDTTDLQAEVVRLREHSARLLAELKEARSAANASATAVEAAQRSGEAWRDAYKRIAVDEPLEAAIRSAAVGPWQYLRDVATANKWLMTEAGDDGIE